MYYLSFEPKTALREDILERRGRVLQRYAVQVGALFVPGVECVGVHLADYHIYEQLISILSFYCTRNFREQRFSCKLSFSKNDSFPSTADCLGK